MKKYLTIHTVQRLLLLVAISSIIIFHTNVLFTKICWVLCAILFAIESQLAIYATFFFDAFFVSAGFFPNLFFTVKHFHIAIILLTLIQLLKGELWIKLKRNCGSAFILFCWLFLLAISTYSSYFQTDTISILRTNANILSLILSSTLLVCIIDNNKTVFKNALFFFILGVCLRVVLAGLIHFGFRFYQQEEGLMNNNHIGFLTSSSIFIVLAFLMTQKRKIEKLFFSILLIFIFSGLLFSCSRTGWISFFLSFICFNFLFFLMDKTNCHNATFIKKRYFLMLNLSIFSLIVLTAFLMNFNIHERISALPQLLTSDYWYFTLHDRQNFGFLGIFRLNQFNTFNFIMKHSYLFGIGLSHQVTDFHSLYMTVIAGTGLVGFFLFLYFCFLWFKSLFIKIFIQTRDGLNLFRLAILSSCFIWLFYSFMETFIVQFHIWLIITAGLILQKEFTQPKVKD